MARRRHGSRSAPSCLGAFVVKSGTQSKTGSLSLRRRVLNDAAGDAAAGVAGGLGAVVGLLMHNDRAAEDGVLRAVDGDVVHGQVEFGLAVLVGFEVAPVAGVLLVVGGVGQAVLVLVGVVVAAGLHAVVAALGAFVDVDGVLLVGLEAGHLRQHADLAAGLGQRDRPLGGVALRELDLGDGGAELLFAIGLVGKGAGVAGLLLDRVGVPGVGAAVVAAEGHEAKGQHGGGEGQAGVGSHRSSFRLVGLRC